VNKQEKNWQSSEIGTNFQGGTQIPLEYSVW